jgi:hypothetical protein
MCDFELGLRPDGRSSGGASSVKNADGKCDPEEMQQAKKGNWWHCGMKARTRQV